MVSIRKNIQTMIEDIKSKSVTERDVDRYRKLTYIARVIYGFLIGCVIISTILSVFNISDTTGYQLALIPALLILLEKPIDYILKVPEINTIVANNFKRLNMGHIVKSGWIILVVCVLSLLLSFSISVIILLLMLGYIGNKANIIGIQKVIFISVLIIWICEKITEKSLDNAIKETIKELSV